MLFMCAGTDLSLLSVYVDVLARPLFVKNEISSTFPKQKAPAGCAVRNPLEGSSRRLRTLKTPAHMTLQPLLGFCFFPSQKSCSSCINAALIISTPWLLFK